MQKSEGYKIMIAVSTKNNLWRSIAFIIGGIHNV